MLRIVASKRAHVRSRYPVWLVADEVVPESIKIAGMNASIDLVDVSDGSQSHCLVKP